MTSLGESNPYTNTFRISASGEMYVIQRWKSEEKGKKKCSDSLLKCTLGEASVPNITDDTLMTDPSRDR